MVRRGFDPQEVGAFLERVADRLAYAERAAEDAESRLSSTSTELDDARAAEEALQLTMVAATQAKDEMLARANAQAEEVRAAAQREAEAVVAEARRQASAMVGESRRDAGGVVSSAQGEHNDLLEQVDQLRTVIGRVRQMLASVAGKVDPALEEAEQLLADPLAAELPEPPAAVIAAAPPSVAFALDADPEPIVSEAVETTAEPSEDLPLTDVVDEAEPESPPVEEEEPFAPPTLEVVADIDDEHADEITDDETAAEAEGLEPPATSADGGTDDDAAEVERLLRQLRGG